MKKTKKISKKNQKKISCKELINKHLLAVKKLKEKEKNKKKHEREKAASLFLKYLKGLFGRQLECEDFDTLKAFLFKNFKLES